MDGPLGGFGDDETEGVCELVLLEAQYASLQRLDGLGELAEQY